MLIDPLFRFCNLLQPTLAMYLADSGLWTYPGPEEIRLAIADLVADTRSLLDRAAAVIDEREQVKPRVAYPISFSGWHDVALQHILPRVIDVLERQRSELERLAATPDDAAAAGLAADALRSARQHLDVLRDVMAKIRAETPTPPAPTAS